MKMPSIVGCMMSECAYNRDTQCHTLAVTVGGPHPMCDTLVAGPESGGGADAH